MKTSTTISAVFAILVASPALAQAAPSTDNGDLGGKMLSCREIIRDKDRLKCFDQVIVEVFGKDEKIEEQREQNFGVRDGDKDQGKTLGSVITSVALDQSLGLATVRLENGQVWQTTSNGTLLYRLREGQTVIIAPSRFSGYRLRIEGVRGYQGVKRVR